MNRSEDAFRRFWKVSARLRRLGEIRYAAYGLSPAQWNLLRALREAGSDGARSFRLTDLANELFLTAPTVTGLVNRLSRVGLVAKTQSGTDQRSRSVTLTAQGRRLTASVVKGQRAWIRDLLAGLDDKDQEQLCRLLDLLADHLNPMFDRQTPAATRTRFLRRVGDRVSHRRSMAS